AVCTLRITVLLAERRSALGPGVKSQTKSQRSPAPGPIRPRPASTTAGRGHIRRRPAPSRDRVCAPYKRGAGGSNPPAPTGLCRSAASLNLARLIAQVKEEPIGDLRAVSARTELGTGGERR